MKFALVVLSVASLLMSSFCPKVKKKTFQITVKATGIAPVEGIMEYALYNNSKVYAKVGKTYKLIRKKITANEMSATFTEVPEGRYAMCIYHDANSNNTCDKNFFGIPTEGYGFSNNMRPILSVPSFEDCSIYVKTDRAISIKLIY